MRRGKIAADKISCLSESDESPCNVTPIPPGAISIYCAVLWRVMRGGAGERAACLSDLFRGEFWRDLSQLHTQLQCKFLVPVKASQTLLLTGSPPGPVLMG